MTVSHAEDFSSVALTVIDKGALDCVPLRLKIVLVYHLCLFFAHSFTMS